MTTFIGSKCCLGQQHRLGTSNKSGWRQIFRANSAWLSQSKENDKSKIMKDISRRKHPRLSFAMEIFLYIFGTKHWSKFPWI